MGSKYYGRAPQRDRFQPKQKEPNRVCQKTLYDNCRPYLCFAPTIDGKQYCDDCAKRTRTLLDRTPPEQPAPKAYAWTQDQIFPRKRA